MKRVAIDSNTALALVGLLSLAVGLASIYPPAALIAVGVLLILYAVLPDRSNGGPTP